MEDGRFVVEMAIGRLGAASVVIMRDGYVLVVGNGNPENHRFQLPGGQAKDGESAKDVAVREVREETGLSLDPWKLELIMGTPQNRKGESGSFLHVFYLYRVGEGEFGDPKGKKPLEWIKASTLRNAKKLLVWPSYKMAIRAAERLIAIPS